MLIHEAACAPLHTTSCPSRTGAEGQEPPRVHCHPGDESRIFRCAEAYPALQEKFNADGYARIDRQRRSHGDTTAGGLRRLEWVLEPTVKILVVALGANDALRGQSPVQTRENLAQIIETANKKGVRVLLTGMQAPPNMGEQFQAEFRVVFPELAAKYHITFLPFLLEGIAGHPELNQEDGIHPTAAAQRMIADLLYPLLQPLADDMLSR
jgi:acyl-CoA thioesterase-1